MRGGAIKHLQKGWKQNIGLSNLFLSEVQEDLTLPRSVLTPRGDGAMAEATHGSRPWCWACSPADRHRAVPPGGAMEGIQAPRWVLLEL